jgi:hypothetical protein
MSVRPIIDAGPALNFFSINQERLLIGVLGRLSAPETVEHEVLGKAQSDVRFRAAAAVWGRVKPNYLEILPDDITLDLGAVVHRLEGSPMVERLKDPQDLGETMVIAHAVVAAEAGADVTVLIDDGAGARKAHSETRRLERLRSQGCAYGSIRLVSTVTILQRAAGGKYLPSRDAMRDIYSRLRACDNGLAPIGSTELLSPRLWNKPKA